MIRRSKYVPPHFEKVRGWRGVYKLWRMINPLAHLRFLATRRFVYKYFPQVFLWVKFGTNRNINQQTYWDELYRREQGEVSTRFGAMVYKILRSKIDFTGKAILDVGCGRGDFLLSIEERCIKFGVDFSQEGLKCLQHRGVRVKRAVLPDLGFKKYFDIITCFETLEHIKPWQQSIKQMIGHLKPGGYLLLSVPYEKRIVVQEHITYFDLDRLYGFLKKRITILEIDFLGPWFLMIAQEIKYDPVPNKKIPQYFKPWIQKFHLTTVCHCERNEIERSNLINL